MSHSSPRRAPAAPLHPFHPALLLATCGGVGRVPVAPGTAGSLVGLACYGAVQLLGGGWLELALLAAVTAGGVWASGAAERHVGRPDPGLVVIDEVAGMLLTLLWLPVGWAGALAGFVLFRLFDVFKPFPVRQAERLGGGWGVMADDLAAGAYAHGGLRLLLWALPASAAL